jgi:hypothetical protein
MEARGIAVLEGGPASAVGVLQPVEETRRSAPLVIIDPEELREAQRDPAVHDLLRSAVAEGTRIEAEGRQRW